MKTKLLYLLCLLLPFTLISKPQKAVTFGWGGRLGDNILDYTHAKWISYKWGIPLLFKDFAYSEQFLFYDAEAHLTGEAKAKYKEVFLDAFSQLDEKVNCNTLYFVKHVCDSKDEHVFNGSYGLFVPVDWNDKKFRTMMQNLIAPKYPLKLFEPPKGIITVALHFRTGGGFIHDTDSMKKSLPLRFPESEYYIKQLKNLHNLVKRDALYVRIFTDSQDPQSVLKMFKGYFKDSNIKFSCRTEGNFHDANVLEDLFSMMKFDCLIRPMSHYSMTASHLTDYKIDIVPRHGVWHNNHFIVDQVNVMQRADWNPKKKMWAFRVN